MGIILLCVSMSNEDGFDQECQVPAFKKYGLNELRRATNEFSTDHLVFKNGEKAPNLVYKGKLENNRLVAVKRFSKLSWADAQQFMTGRGNRRWLSEARESGQFNWLC